MVIICFVLFEGIMYLASIPFKNTIKNSSDVKKCVSARKNIRVVRLILTPVLVVAFIIFIVVYSQNNNVPSDIMTKDMALVTVFTIASGWSKLIGHINAYTKEQYFEKHKKGFALFLRAFNKDKYGSGKNPYSFNVFQKKSYSFEEKLTKTVKSICKIKMCAVGMTKEVDAPYGADRVYVSDISWQADVRELMEKSKLIFIYMSSRDSCIWEINQSRDLLKKTCFIIESREIYEGVVKKQNPGIYFPAFDKIIESLNDKDIAQELKDKTTLLGLMIIGSHFYVTKTNVLVLNQLVENVKQLAFNGKSTFSGVGNIFID